MSDTTTPHSTNDACEQLLDYVYGELDEARKRTFEEHLATCARCQTEAASFGRVRSAVKRVMPAVEPSGNVNGALHAQLMHAAAQRKPRRGALLSFPRKIVQHPAWAMAAMFTIVGGAIAINWSRGKMAMPAMSESDQKVAAAPPMPEPIAAERQSDKPMAAAEASVEKNKYKELQTPKTGLLEDGKSRLKGGDLAAKAKDEEVSADKLALDTPTGTLTVQRPAPHRAVATATPAKEAPPKSRKVSSNVGAKFDDAFLADGTTDHGNVNGVIGGAGGASSGALGGEGAASKSSAPDSLSRAGKAELQEQAPGRDRGYAAATQPPKKQTWGAQNGAPAQAPPPPPAATVPASPSPVVSSRSVQAPTGPNKETETLRKKAEEAARSGRCDEAIKMYQELDKLSQFITPTERLNYVRCLSQRGRQEEALKRLDELKNDKRMTNSELQKVETEISDARRRQEPRAEKKAAKKPAAAPAARAVEQQQQRATDAAPAESAPARPTDTKTQKAY
ncbi:MAG: hypothetical protein JWN44_237 [Myxococcales bacterium]|nr:hypothetical protein [Myxococcales bacterium]